MSLANHPSKRLPCKFLSKTFHVYSTLKLTSGRLTFLLQTQIDVVHRQELIMRPALRHSTLKRVTIV